MKENGVAGLTIVLYSATLASWQSGAAPGRDRGLYSGAVQCQSCSGPNSGRDSSCSSWDSAAVLYFQKCVSDLLHLAACVWPPLVACGRSAVVRPLFCNFCPCLGLQKQRTHFCFG
ncbi:hypothetical protein E2542_SST15907 [Spatholobus suberectus]|nr:hypothetical protein E2542_SST15907 [Spatholobus suberectus]